MWLLNSMGSILESMFKCPALAISRMAPTCCPATGFGHLERQFNSVAFTEQRKRLLGTSERKCGELSLLSGLCEVKTDVQREITMRCAKVTFTRCHIVAFGWWKLLKYIV